MEDRRCPLNAGIRFERILLYSSFFKEREDDAEDEYLMVNRGCSASEPPDLDLELFMLEVLLYDKPHANNDTKSSNSDF